MFVPPITTVTVSPAFTPAPFGTPKVRVSPPAPVRDVAAVTDPVPTTVTSAWVRPEVPVPAGRATLMVETLVGFRAALVTNVTVYSVAAPTTTLPSETVGTPWMAPVMVSPAAFAVIVSMDTSALVRVVTVWDPGSPEIVGFTVPANVITNTDPAVIVAVVVLTTELLSGFAVMELELRTLPQSSVIDIGVAELR